MTMKQLECFVQVTETLNFAEAAQYLYISQPAVTYQIKSLEDELGLELFIRTKRKVELTPAGVSFYNDIKDVLVRTSIAVAKAKNHSRAFEAKMSVCYEGNNAVKLLPDILKAYNKKNPHVHLYIMIADYKEKRSLFINHKSDLIFTVREAIEDLPDAGYAELFTGVFSCVVPKEHHLAQKDMVTTADLQGQSLIFLSPLKCPPKMEQIQNQIQLQLPDSIVYFSDSALISYPMIKGGLGIAVMPNFVCPEDEELRIIPYDAWDDISFGIAWHKNAATKEIKEFVSTVKHVYHGFSCGK